MEVVHRAADIPKSRASSRGSEPSCRRRIKDSQGPLQLDDSPTHILTDQEKLSPLENDLFASHLIHQLPCYFSWRLDPAAEVTDVFTQDWS